MNITLYHNSSENYAVPKTLTQITSIDGTLRETCSVSDPVIKIQGDLETLVTANYCYIDKFQRYYFIQDIISIRDDLIELHLHVDVLESFQLDISLCSGIVHRNENLYNLYIDDKQFNFYNKPIVETYAFPNSFKQNPDLVLAVAGN